MRDHRGKNITIRDIRKRDIRFAVLTTLPPLGGMTIGERIRAVRRAYGLSQARLAEKVGVKQNTISKWESGESEPSRDQVKRVAAALGVSSNQIELDEFAEQACTIPIMGQIGAGQAIEPLDSSWGIARIATPPTAPPHAEAFLVSGPSMLPYLRDGNVVVCWNWTTDLDRLLSEPAVCKLADNSMWVKVISHGSRRGLWTLNSVNALYEPMRDVRISTAAPCDIVLRKPDWRD